MTELPFDGSVTSKLSVDAYFNTHYPDLKYPDDIEGILIFNKLLICYVKYAKYIFIDEKFFTCTLNSWSRIYMDGRFIIATDYVYINRWRVTVRNRNNPVREIYSRLLKLGFLTNQKSLIKLVILNLKLRKLIR